MTTHKAIRDAAEEGPYYTAVVAKPDLRALLDDLDAKTAEVEALRREPMTEECLIKALVAQALFFKEGAHTVTSLENDIRATLAHHHITQKEQ